MEGSDRGRWKCRERRGQSAGDRVQGGSGGLGRVTLRERSEAAGRTEKIKGPQDLLVLKTIFTTKSSGNGVRRGPGGRQTQVQIAIPVAAEQGPGLWEEEQGRDLRAGVHFRAAMKLGE